MFIGVLGGVIKSYKNISDFIKSELFKSKLSKLKEYVNKKGFKFATKSECESLPKTFFHKIFHGTVGDDKFTKWFDVNGIRFAAVVVIYYNYGIEIDRTAEIYAMIKKPNNKITSIKYAQTHVNK